MACRAGTGRRAADGGSIPSVTRSLGRSLPDALVRRFSQADLVRRLDVAMPLVTIDAEGRPHAMVVSHLEIKAYDARTLGVVIQATSRSARNLAERRVATLLVIEPDVTAYVKLRTLDGPLDVEDGAQFRLAYFLLEVDDVLEDAPADFEGAPRITAGLRYGPVPSLDDPWAHATRAALASPRARA